MLDNTKKMVLLLYVKMHAHHEMSLGSDTTQK